MLKQILYASSSVHLMKDEDLADILRSSRRNNAVAGVTGALLYADGNFLQVLEGAPDAVDAVYARVARDTRHRRVLKFVDRAVGQRLYADWAMGLVRPEALPEADRDALRTVWDVGASDDALVQHMLRAFLSSAPEPPAARRQARG